MSDSVIYVFNFQTGELKFEIKSEKSWQHEIKISRDDKFILSCGSDHEIKFWDIKTGKLVKKFLERTSGDLFCLAITDNGKHIISGGSWGDLNFWDYASCKKLRSIPFGSNFIRSIATTKDSRYVAAGDK
jgi:WD40 repeat protein